MTVLAFVLVLARVSTFVATLPLFGGTYVPRLVKIGLAMALTCFWASCPETAHYDYWISSGAQVRWLAVGVALGREALLGAVLGFGFGLFLLPARVAGGVIGGGRGHCVARCVAH